MSVSAGSATYLYCVLHRSSAPSLDKAPVGLPGMGRPHALAVAPGLWLVAAAAPLDRYAGAAIDRRLGDLDWVSACALAHEAVVEHAATLGTAVPMKLFTLFSSEARALRHVRGRRGALARLVRRIAGREEWGVRVRAAARTREPARPARARPLSGTQFLLAKQREAVARRRRATPAAAPVRRVLAALGREADAAKRRAIPREASRVSGLVADVVYLVRARERPRFVAAATQSRRRLAGEGYDLDLTGPWPPYHFIPGRQ